ncbi:MAG: hypothetical protein U1E05_00785, partial [Patescibacteria group bacterium]|nr:hypothetical protein [Patescibacteria group bacterium]
MTNYAQSKSLFDKLKTGLHNNKLVALLALLGLIIISIANFSNATRTIIDIFIKHDYIPAFRVSYFTLEGHALPKLIQGELDEDLNNYFHGKRPIIWKNDVHRALAEINNKFARRIKAHYIVSRVRSEATISSDNSEVFIQMLPTS